MKYFIVKLIIRDDFQLIQLTGNVLLYSLKGSGHFVLGADVEVEGNRHF